MNQKATVGERLGLSPRTKALLGSEIGEATILRYLPPLTPGNPASYTWNDLFMDLAGDHQYATDPNRPASVFSIGEAVLFFNYFWYARPCFYEKTLFDVIKHVSCMIYPHNLKYLPSGKVPDVSAVPDAEQRQLIRKSLSLRKQQLAAFKKRFMSLYVKLGLYYVAKEYVAQYKHCVKTGDKSVDLGRTIVLDCKKAVEGVDHSLWLQPYDSLTNWLRITGSQATPEWLAAKLCRIVNKELLKGE